MPDFLPVNTLVNFTNEFIHNCISCITIVRKCYKSIENTIIGIASKDLSQIYGDHVLISNAQIGYALYQKRPEFGPANIDITNSKMEGYIGLDYLIQNDSTLELNNQKMLERSKKKETLLIEKLIIGETIQW